MSRTPEALQKPDWYQLALAEVARIPKFKDQEEETARQVVHIVENAYLGPGKPGDYKYMLRFGSKVLFLTLGTKNPDGQRTLFVELIQL